MDRFLRRRWLTPLNFVPLAVALAATAVCIREKQFLWPSLNAIPRLSGAWMMFSMTGRCLRLADRACRTELSLTELPARDFLLPRLLWPLGIMLAPILMCATVLVPMLWIRTPINGGGSARFFSPLYLGDQISVAAVSTAGVLDLISWLCRTRSPGVLPVIVPAAWSSVLVFGPIGFAVLCFLTNYSPLAPVLAAPFAFLMYWMARRKWHSLYRSFYETEIGGPRPKPFWKAAQPTPASGGRK